MEADVLRMAFTNAICRRNGRGTSGSSTEGVTPTCLEPETNPPKLSAASGSDRSFDGGFGEAVIDRLFGKPAAIKEWTNHRRDHVGDWLVRLHFTPVLRSFDDSLERCHERLMQAGLQRRNFRVASTIDGYTEAQAAD